MKLLSWNVNGRVGATLERQLERVGAVAPDALALQEVTAASHLRWDEALQADGYCVLSTAALVRAPYPGAQAGERKYFNVTATKGHAEPLPGLTFADSRSARAAFPEKYLVARVSSAGMVIDVHNAHLPPGSTWGVVKVHAFEAIRRRVDEPTPAPRVLCGDFNTPKAEGAGGLTTFGSRHPELRERWDAAERSILEHPCLRDVYRERHRDGEPYPTSHVTRSGPKRYDHVYASRELRALSCRYLGEWREEGLSDHAAVEADLVVA